MFKKKMNYSSVFMDLMMMFAFAFTFVACSSDDENTANQSVVDYAKRLEFPRLQDASGNSLYVVLDEETNEVNYSVEYNRDKKAQIKFNNDWNADNNVEIQPAKDDSSLEPIIQYYADKNDENDDFTGIYSSLVLLSFVCQIFKVLAPGIVPDSKRIPNNNKSFFHVFMHLFK